jgi:tetrapyrrole methylase family protein/MazG family protein
MEIILDRERIVAELLKKEYFCFDDLVEIMRLLRSEGGCPWDIEQDHGDIRSCMIEEAYEVVEAIDNEDADLLREELGDVLFQVIFHSRIEDEKGSFNVGDVIDGICKKMIHRHPHVFSNGKLSSSNEVIDRWEQIKAEEKQRKTLASRLKAIPPMLPSLMRAEKVIKKIKLADGHTKQEMIDEIRTSVDQLSTAEKIEDELGTLLFSVAKLSAVLDLDAEKELDKTVNTLISRIEMQENEKK